MKPVCVETELGGRTLKLESGYLAKQASGSVVCTYGDTVVFSSVCTSDPRPGINFFPLSVDYREKTQAAGKFPGGFIKREGRPSTKEILTCRLIDRPVRPLFPEEFNDEVQICSFVVQVDKKNDPQLPAMLGSFAACHIADMPFLGPIAAVRVGRIDGELVMMPTQDQTELELDLIVAGSRDALVMVEGGATEVSEEDFLTALDFGHDAVKKLCDLMDEFLAAVGTEKTEWVAPEKESHPLGEKVAAECGGALEAALATEGKHERYAAVKAARDAFIEANVDAEAEDAREQTGAIKDAWYELEKRITRDWLLEGRRIDGRKVDDIRPIHIKAGWMSRLHGSAIFTRGETQALVVCTLGTLKDQQIVDGLGEEYSKKFDLQYNFPPYCVGECKPIRGVSRREIGHGSLAERALLPIQPEPIDFPYTIRIISDILESNGSSSMASVCGGTLAMMDAGVPIKQPVAGIAMGLLKDGENVKILSDILGSEDHYGDMDFKVAGTGRGITAVQMDIKITGITRQIMQDALEQARQGRLHILQEMMKAISRPAESISEFAPRLMIMKIPVEKIGMVIGPGGKMIKKIQEETGANIEIEDDGTVHLSSTEGGQAEVAKSRIEMLVAEIEVGQTYRDCKVVSVKDFGCFVEVLPGQEGLCHVSELSDEYVGDVGDVVKMGDRIDVKVIARDEQDRVKLSRRHVLLEDKGIKPEDAGGGDDRGPRGGGDRGPRGGGDRGGRGRGGDRGGDRGGRGGGGRGRGGDRGGRGRDGDRGGRDRDRPRREPRGATND